MAMDDLPVLKKCCYCVPLRYGLLTWGYIKLVGAALVLTFLTIIVVKLRHFFVGDILIITIITLIAVIFTTEIILHIIFIIGAHKKNVKLLQAYYSYAIFMWIVMIIMAFGFTSFLVFNIVVNNADLSILITLNVVGFFCSIAVQTFLLISLRSEIIKLRSNCPYRFMKNENDPEGTINSVKEDEDITTENGTMRIL